MSANTARPLRSSDSIFSSMPPGRFTAGIYAGVAILFQHRHAEWRKFESVKVIIASLFVSDSSTVCCSDGDRYSARYAFHTVCHHDVMNWNASDRSWHVAGIMQMSDGNSIVLGSYAVIGEFGTWRPLIPTYPSLAPDANTLMLTYQVSNSISAV